MSNIQSARGLSVPAFQPASNGEKQGGNGGGGMFFGQQPEDESSYHNYFDPFYFPDSSTLSDVPFFRPLPKSLFGTIPVAMTRWKTALAEQLYAGIRDIQAE